MKKRVRFSNKVSYRYYTHTDKIIVKYNQYDSNKLAGILKKNNKRQQFNASFFTHIPSNAYKPLLIKRQSLFTTVKPYRM